MKNKDTFITVHFPGKHWVAFDGERSADMGSEVELVRYLKKVHGVELKYYRGEGSKISGEDHSCTCRTLWTRNKNIDKE